MRDFLPPLHMCYVIILELNCVSRIKAFWKSENWNIYCFFSPIKSINKVFLSIRLLNLNMGGWQLEAAKMALYMVFPVGLFYYFNQAEYFEDWMINLRREMYPTENRVNKKAFEDTIREMKEKREREYLRLLEEKESGKSSHWIVVQSPIELCMSKNVLISIHVCLHIPSFCRISVLNCSFNWMAVC